MILDFLISAVIEWVLHTVRKNVLLRDNENIVRALVLHDVT